MTSPPTTDRCLPCGAIIHASDVTPCPDPYCRGCRYSDGEVIDPPWTGRNWGPKATSTG